jgi:hypothetical protein
MTKLDLMASSLTKHNRKTFLAENSPLKSFSKQRMFQEKYTPNAKNSLQSPTKNSLLICLWTLQWACENSTFLSVVHRSAHNLLVSTCANQNPFEIQKPIIFIKFSILQKHFKVADLPFRIAHTIPNMST